MKQLTAKDFHNDLLKVLYSMSGGVAGVTLNSDDVYAPVFALKGILKEDFGKTDNGIWWPEKWVQWAFRSLKEKGLAESPGRGQWSLTLKGLDAAKVFAQVPSTGALSFADDGTYHPDPYIRAVGLSKHACLGLYSSQSETCTECSARVLCQQAQHVKYSTLASILQDEDDAPVFIPPPAPAATRYPVSQVVADPNIPRFFTSPVKTTVPTSQSSMRTKSMRDPFADTRGDEQAIRILPVAVHPCAHCGNDVLTTEYAWWVKSPKVTAFYHEFCYGTDDD